MLAKKFKFPIQNSSQANNSIKKITSPHIIIKIFPHQKEWPRFGVIINKNIARLAVQRNRLKRCIFLYIEGKISIIPPADYIIILQKPVLKEELLDEINNLFNLKIIG